jgi:hypothetical protein
MAIYFSVIPADFAEGPKDSFGALLRDKRES